MIMENQWFWARTSEDDIKKAAGPYRTRTDALGAAYEALSPQLTMFGTPHVAFVGRAKALSLSDRDENLLDYTFTLAADRAFYTIKQNMQANLARWTQVPLDVEKDLRKRLEELFWQWLAEHDFDTREFYLDRIERYEFRDVGSSNLSVRSGDPNRTMVSA